MATLRCACCATTPRPGWRDWRWCPRCARRSRKGCRCSAWRFPSRCESTDALRLAERTGRLASFTSPHDEHDERQHVRQQRRELTEARDPGQLELDVEGLCRGDPDAGERG